jgi:hypothetical protein
MYDHSTGWQIGVDRGDTVGAYIIVSRRQVAAVSSLLASNQVPHAIEAFVPDPFQVDDPVEAVVRLGACVEDLLVQQILDRAP